MRRSLERSDTVINLRNQEIATLNSRLAAKDETIAEAAEQFDRLDQEVTQLRSQLATERADREEIEGELSDLKQKSATAGKDLPDAAEVYNQFKAENPKTKITYKDVVAIVATAQAMIEKSCDDTSQGN